jgi:ribonuclease J
MQIPVQISEYPLNSMAISFLGGLGEIGLNMMTIEYGETILVVDAGLMFPEEHMLGIDFVIPDITYLRDNRERIAALILTHGHEDHIGALPFIVKDIQVPMYGARFTLELVRQKLRECRLSLPVDLRQVSAGESLNIGPFQVEFIRVCHSIVDCFGLAVRTPLGTLIHSGDFKIDPTPPDGLGTDVERFAHYGRAGVLALLSDSTNVELEKHSLSEKAVRETLREIFSRCKGRIVMGVFASNIQRIQQAVDLSVLYRRKVIFNGKSMVATVRLAQELGYLNVPPEVEIDIRDMARFPESKITLITTGSQAEPLSAITRTALGQHKQIVIRPHDTVIFSSRFIPGNERAITSVINLLCRQGAEVIYETVSDIHASGHAYREELKEMMHLTRPRYFIPIHGEYRHLVRHAKVAQEMGIPQEKTLVAENGHRIVFYETGAEMAQTVPAGRVFVDGKGVGDVDRPVLRDRRHLSEDGMVLAVVVVDRKTGELLAPPDIISRGFIQEKEKDNLLEYAKCVVLEVLEGVVVEPAINWSEVSERIKRELKRFFNTAVERRPVILPVVVPM